MEYDAIVVGGGPAGISAAGWLARYRRKVLLLDGGEHRNRWTRQVHGYLGRDPTSPQQLLEGARAGLLPYPTSEIREATATGAARARTGDFVVETEEGPVRGLRLVLCTGVADEFPEVEGFFEHYGASVFHCPTCDGYEAQGCHVVALGWSADVAGFALNLLDWAEAVTVVTNGPPFQGEEVHREALARHGVPVVEDEATELVGGRGDLRAVRLKGGQTIGCQLAFFSIAHHPKTELARQLGCEVTEEGYVAVDLEGATSVKGVYAAGDLTPGLQLVQVAAAKGAAAGVACALSLRGETGVIGSPDPGPDVEAELDPASG